MINELLEKYLNEGTGGRITINMGQFRKNWKVNSDNVHYYEKILATKGKMVTFDVEQYVRWLNEYNIFYTLVK